MARRPAGKAKTSRPQPLPALDVRSLPGPETIHRRQLDNGVVVLARENFASPSIVLSGYLTVGSLEETRPQAGLADLTASALLRGTVQHSFAEIYESLESVGAALSIGSGKHYTAFQGKGLAEDLKLLLSLLSEALRSPTFPEAQVLRLRGEKLTGLRIRDDNTGARADMAFDELAYPGHPYAVSADGYTDTLTALTAEDLSAFHGKHYGPRGLVIVVVGAIQAPAALEVVGEHFADWAAAGQPTRPPLPPVAQPKGLVRRDVVLAGKSQCDAVLGTPGPSRFDPHYLAAALGNNILGRFGLMGRIGDAVREAAGLAYYAYSAIGSGPGPEPWQVVAGVHAENVDRAIDLIRAELRTFTARRVTNEELRDNQAHFIGRLPLQLETNEGVAAALAHLERFSLGLDYYQRYPAAIQAVTRDEVLEVARQYLNADNLAVAVAGSIGEQA